MLGIPRRNEVFRTRNEEYHLECLRSMKSHLNKEESTGPRTSVKVNPRRNGRHEAIPPARAIDAPPVELY